MVGMGYQRNLIEALFRGTKDPIANIDQAMEAMYDPLRHTPYIGPDMVDEIANRFRRDYTCAICLNPAQDHAQDHNLQRNSMAIHDS